MIITIALAVVLISLVIYIIRLIEEIAVYKEEIENLLLKYKNEKILREVTEAENTALLTKIKDLENKD